MTNSISAAKLRTAANCRETFNDLEPKFAAYVTEKSDQRHIKGKLLAQGVNLVVDALGFRVVARPRMIVSESGEFFDEYPFSVDTDGKDIVVYTLYLSQSGKLCRSLIQEDPKRIFADILDEATMERIVHEVSAALLDSSLFQPSVITAAKAQST